MAAPKGYSKWLVHAAASYGSNPKLIDRMAVLESGRNQGSVNDWDSNAKAGHPSTGILQFIPSTFDDFSRKAYAANPAAWKGVKRDTKDWRAQLLTTAWAVENGLGSHWATYDRARASAGGSKLAKQAVPFAGIGGSQVGSVQQGGSKPETAAGGLSFSTQQRAALAMVFDKNPTMKSMIGLIPETQTQQVDVVRPTSNTAKVAGGGGGAIGAQLVQTAMGEVGKTANDAMRYIKASGGTGYEPWCGDFVRWVFKQRGLKMPPTRYVPDLLKWAKANNRITSNPRAGDLVVFDWKGDGIVDHVELVRGRIKGGVATVGGNTSGSKSGSQVAAKNRVGGNQQYIRFA